MFAVRHVENSLPKRETEREIDRKREKEGGIKRGRRLLQKRNKNEPTIKWKWKHFRLPQNCFLANDKIHFYAKANVRICVCGCVCVPLVGGSRAGDTVNLRFGVLKRSRRRNSCSFITVRTYIIRIHSFYFFCFQIVCT